MQTTSAPNTNAYEKKRLPNFQYSLVDEQGEVKQLLIGKELCVAFDYFTIYSDGFIEALHDGKWYGFNPDLTPIERVINGEPVVAFDWLDIFPNGEISANHNGKWYGFNADGTPMLTSI